MKLDDTDLWHKRLTHMNSADTSEVHKHADDVPKIKRMKNICRACSLGKANKLPFTGKFHRAKDVGDIIHSDIVAPIEQPFPNCRKIRLGVVERWCSSMSSLQRFN